MKIFCVLLICLLVLSCNKKNLLSNTKWEYKLDNEISDSLIFINESNYSYYQAELEEFFTGYYHIIKDTLFLIENHTSENSDREFRYTFKVGDKNLSPVKLEEKLDGIWTDSNFKFDSSYFLTLVQNSNK